MRRVVHGGLITSCCFEMYIHIGDNLLLDCYSFNGCLCGAILEGIRGLCGLVNFFVECAYGGWLDAYVDNLH